jgi:hypothetical protein
MSEGAVGAGALGVEAAVGVDVQALVPKLASGEGLAVHGGMVIVARHAVHAGRPELAPLRHLGCLHTPNKENTVTKQFIGNGTRIRSQNNCQNTNTFTKDVLISEKKS